MDVHTCMCVCVDSTHSVVHLQLTLKRVDQTAALTQLLLQDAHVVLQPKNTQIYLIQTVILKSSSFYSKQPVEMLAHLHHYSCEDPAGRDTFGGAVCAGSFLDERLVSPLNTLSINDGSS